MGVRRERGPLARIRAARRGSLGMRASGTLPGLTRGARRSGDARSARVDHRRGGRHEYLISGTAIDADVVFSLPQAEDAQEGQHHGQPEETWWASTPTRTGCRTIPREHARTAAMNMPVRTCWIASNVLPCPTCGAFPVAFPVLVRGRIGWRVGSASMCSATRRTWSAAGIGGATTPCGASASTSTGCFCTAIGMGRCRSPWPVPESAISS